MASNFDQTRFRSFVERYVIERAKYFKDDTDFQDAWTAVEMAKKIYFHVEQVSDVEAAKQAIYETSQGAAQAAQSGLGYSSYGPKGATGMAGHGGPYSSLKGAAPVSSQVWTGRKSP